MTNHSAVFSHLIKINHHNCNKPAVHVKHSLVFTICKLECKELNFCATNAFLYDKFPDPCAKWVWLLAGGVTLVPMSPRRFPGPRARVLGTRLPTACSQSFQETL